ncbi:MAG TPA: hypothetical protein VN950_24075 [Terriglobales bacterium]|nr:hypothetical protein [Terriglobales bacterium]
MFQGGVCLPGVSAQGLSANRISVPRLAVSLVAVALLAGPHTMLAQRGGGGFGGRGTPGTVHGRPLICVHDCPDTPEGTSSENDLKNFEHLMAVQATADQSAAFIKVMQYAQTASAQLQSFRDTLQKVRASTPLSDRAASLDKVIKEARAGNQNFLSSFSPSQTSGLKDLAERLAKADADLENQTKAFDRTLETAKAESEPMATSAANVDKALTSFQTEQVALAAEMGIILPASGQDLTLRLPPVTTSIDFAGQSIAIAGAGVISRTPAADGHNLFGLKYTADFSDLQQNITDVLRTQLNHSPRCGERIEIKEGMLIPQAPASIVVAHLHYEHWICPPVQGWESLTELSTGDGAIEVKLTPSVEAKGESGVDSNSDLHLASEISRVDADGFLREMLLTGPLGVRLREQITASVLSIMQKGANLKTAIPPTAQELASIRKAQFQDAGAGRLTLILDGQLQLTDEQAKLFTDQLRERLSAQKTSPP